MKFNKISRKICNENLGAKIFSFYFLELKVGPKVRALILRNDKNEEAVNFLKRQEKSEKIITKI